MTAEESDHTIISDPNVINMFSNYMDIVDVDCKHMHEYVRFRERQLAPLSAVQKIYLDTNYWIWMRDVILGRPAMEKHVHLLDLCSKISSSGRAIFPISDALMIEFNRQIHADSRNAMIKLVESLSNNVSFKSNAAIRLEETRSFMNESVKSIDVDLATDIWTVPANSYDFIARASLGGVNSITKRKYPAIPRRMQIMIAENLLNLTFGDFVREHKPDNDTSDYEKSAKLNSELNRAQPKINKQKAARDELLEGMEEYACAFRVLSYELAFRGKLMPIVCEPTLKELRQTMGLMFGASTGEMADKARLHLRMINVSSQIYAAYRMNRSRGFEKNDGIDIVHASMAIPYCSAFLTERTLAAKINKETKVLEFYRNCIVSGSIDESIRVLESI